jgi:hypothetical protein
MPRSKHGKDGLLEVAVFRGVSTWELHKGLHTHRTLDIVQVLAKQKRRFPAPRKEKESAQSAVDARARGGVPFSVPSPSIVACRSS